MDELKERQAMPHYAVERKRRGGYVFKELPPGVSSQDVSLSDYQLEPGNYFVHLRTAEERDDRMWREH